MSNNKKWLIVIGYTVLILASLPWTRALWNFVGPKRGFFILTGLYAGSAGLLYIKQRNVFLIGIIGFIIFIIFKLVPLPVERIHFIEYGILGWLAYWANGKNGFVKPLLFVVVIGILDELIQGILPNRIFDMRDIWMNVIGGSIGIVLRIYER